MGSNKQKTAVEWLETQIRDLIPNDIGSQLKFKNKIKQAKEMEKEQKRKDFTDGYMHGDYPLNHSVIDKWYEKTYGGEEQ
jgi:hypothetical protein